MTDRPHYNPNQLRVPKGQAHGGEWTRVGAEGIRADPEPPPADAQPTLANLGGLPVASREALRALFAAAMRAEAQRAAAALAMQEAARRRQLGDPGAAPGEGSPYSRTEVPRGTAADQAVLERFALFDALSARNNDKQVAVLEFKAGKYERAGDLVVTRVGMLSREQAQQFCRYLPEVQEALDQAVEDVARDEPALRISNPALFGTKVHVRAAEIINGWGLKDVRAEIYWLDGVQTRGLGSVGLDVQEEPPDSKLFCIYDHKTGRRRLSWKRMLVLAAKAWVKGRTNIIVMETRPGEGPPIEGP